MKQLVLLGALLAGCAGGPPPCDPSPTNAIIADCMLLKAERGPACLEDPAANCPDIIAECDKRIDAIPDEELCR